eukprot:6175844-Pleurochrysis_carterae.AAC.4
MESASQTMSMLSKSETGPSSSTFQQRSARAAVKSVLSEPGLSSEYKVDRSSTEDARVGVTLCESPGFEPGEERCLPTTACLRHSVDRFDYLANACGSVAADDLVPRWRPAVYDLTVLELALEGSERAERRGAHCSAETLHAQASLEGSAALPLVYPDETHKVASGRHVRAIDHAPAAVGLVVRDFSALGSHPPGAVVAQRLLTRLRIRAVSGEGECAAGAAAAKVRVDWAGGPRCEQHRRLTTS